MMLLAPALMALLLAPFNTAPSGNALLGDWREPGGSVIRVFTCGTDVCARLVQIDPHAPSQFDEQDPDPAKRTQRLCGLRIGYGFHLQDPTHAEDGHIYDPKSGKTYHGTITRTGDTLQLRGYVGIKAFGRTEEWTRVPQPVKACAE